jgi:hypothetical protein
MLVEIKEKQKVALGSIRAGQSFEWAQQYFYENGGRWKMQYWSRN